MLPGVIDTQTGQPLFRIQEVSKLVNPSPFRKFDQKHYFLYHTWVRELYKNKAKRVNEDL